MGFDKTVGVHDYWCKFYDSQSWEKVGFFSSIYEVELIQSIDELLQSIFNRPSHSLKVCTNLWKFQQLWIEPVMMDQSGIRTRTLYSVSCSTIWAIGCAQSILTYLHCQNQSLIIIVLFSCVYGNGILMLNSQVPNNSLKQIDRYKPLTSQVIESKAYQHDIAKNKQLIDHKWQFIEK